MIIGGLSPGYSIPEQRKVDPVEKEKVSQEIGQQEQELKSEIDQQEQQRLEKGEKSKLVMNDYQLKELLFLMSSKGNSASVEKLAQLLKQEKEMLSRGH